MRDRRLRLDQAAGDGLAHIVVRHEFVGARLEQLQHRLVRHRLDAGAGRAAPAAGLAAGAALAPPPAIAASTSALTTRPCGPVPLTAATSTPASLAMRRASGEAKMREPSADAAASLAAADLPAGHRLGLAGQRPPLSASQISPPRAGATGAFCLLRRRLRTLGRRAGILALGGKHRDQRVDLDAFGAGRDDDLRDRAFIDSLDLHGRLVGLDLGDHVARLDLVAFLDQPLGEIALFHGRRERGHGDVDRHVGALPVRLGR